MAGYARFIDNNEIEYMDLAKEEYGKRYDYFHDFIREIAVCDCTFTNCKTIREVVLPETMNHIGCYAFKGCDRLTRVVIPETIRSVDEYAFSTCYNLEFIGLPEGIREVPYHMAEHCPNLSMIALPSTLKTIRRDAFYGCTNLNVIIFNGTTAQWNALVLENNCFAGCGEFAIKCKDGALKATVE